MSDPFEGRPFPRGVLIGAAALIAFVIAAVALVRLTGVGGPEIPRAPVYSSTQLRFVDQGDGTTQVFTPGKEEAIATLESGVDGFVLGVLRAMARERSGNRIEMGEPFLLVLLEDGRLIFRDPSTGREIDLRAFGVTNAQSFAKLLQQTDQATEAGGPSGEQAPRATDP